MADFDGTGRSNMPSPYMDPMGLGSFWWIGFRCFFLFTNTVGLSFIRRNLKWLPGFPKIVAQQNGKLVGMEGFLCGL